VEGSNRWPSIDTFAGRARIRAVLFNDFLSSPSPISRRPVMGRNGAVATSQPLAAQAGLSILQAGGNAVDAALATAIALTVVEPTSNGIGSDAFAMVWADGRLAGLNGSGRAPALLTAESIRSAGHEVMPERGWIPVTVPGAVSAWVAMHDTFGRLDFAALFEPAIAMAEHGYPVSPVVARAWGRAERLFRHLLAGPRFDTWSATFAPGGSAPVAGQLVRLPDQAATLRTIARTGGRAMYTGELAEQIDAFSRSTGGFIRAGDLAGHRCDWVDPISTNYRGYDVWEIPPNGQGITALVALNILEGFDSGSIAAEGAESWHLQIEAMKLAFADAAAYVADPSFVEIPVRGLLDKAYAGQRRALIGESASEPRPGTPPRGGTVYLCTADSDGTMVSMIQSDYMGFGSGMVIPGTGIVMQNRGANFSLVDGHPNVLAPGKRSYHTIIPSFLSRDGAAVGPFGVMGGFMQPQGHVQVIVRTIDLGMHPQAALDAPRWKWEHGRQVSVERHTPLDMIDDLRARGHDVRVGEDVDGFGRGQIIWRSGDTLVAASESRADGQAVVY
jgi:gamma-glutamyltranspeptidase / glutathione hydrolase